jgi:hypothetical protein
VTPHVTMNLWSADANDTAVFTLGMAREARVTRTRNPTGTTARMNTSKYQMNDGGIMVMPAASKRTHRYEVPRLTVAKVRKAGPRSGHLLVTLHHVDPGRVAIQQNARQLLPKWRDDEDHDYVRRQQAGEMAAEDVVYAIPDRE